MSNKVLAIAALVLLQLVALASIVGAVFLAFFRGEPGWGLYYALLALVILVFVALISSAFSNLTRS